MFSFANLLTKTKLPHAKDALVGRTEAMVTSSTHFVNGNSLKAPFPDGIKTIVFGLGCFWGAERAFWQLDGVFVTAVGYGAGITPNPTYSEVCSGKTGHNEVVLVAYDPKIISLDTLLKTFWESHDPTQGMRQGNDVGTQYRSGIYTSSDDQLSAATASKTAYETALHEAGHTAPITTEIIALDTFYYAEADHQQYLAKNPSGYCGLGGVGVTCPAP